ncbi:hypothetical protein PKOR_15900 [Pontibacter korlensis]|uniref:Uncharacterized protein n=2 Tax=Pontibacter korlensis TaxID=400092 RepID=A0A0E3ZFE8_9BACT|nr:hypothetical protein PKOR_15900 [Pontibacter korlensis]
MDILQHFCARYPEEAVQLEIRRWFILALKDDYDGLCSGRTRHLITFFEQLRQVLSALYRLQDNPDTIAPLALALENLSQQLTPNWTLLVDPAD